ncbi:hypothetical protein [Methanobrevibacter curvatus]|uniref:Uncharacterized protein n=1 Tax=Methanobrevibacter curvatus TaxID=49547 RepID=A0A165ZR43_9EURY|nr:hypothetical protein [Methanobrevibacter curvatus]KZX11056.1 hypothetical protein MBCUR_15710 [Methanobrevibacter curvatus]
MVIKRNLKKNKEKDKLKKLKSIDNKGNMFSILGFLMIIVTIILSVLILNTLLSENQTDNNLIGLNSFNYEIENYKNNIPNIGYETLQEISEEVCLNKTSLEDSKEEIKSRLNEKLQMKKQEFYNATGINIENHVLYVENNEDPFYINVILNLSGKKANNFYSKIITEKISVINLKDPLPFLKCGNDSSFTYNETKINYGNSLRNYLFNNNQTNSDYYVNASSPLLIKKCIFDPYIQHGIGKTLKNCIENGYYHESADGACYLHRLEGKGDCLDYGFETFIISSGIHNSGLSSTSASDHVIFGHDSYPGESMIYNTFNGMNEVIILDSSHKTKYGLS